MDQDPYNLPISTSDAANMFKKNVHKNERPYTAKVLKLNNRIVDKWKKSVLDETCDRRGCLPSGRVMGSWELYKEGTEIIEFIKLKEQGLIEFSSKEIVEYWKNVFENLTVEELYSYGASTISYGWTIIQNHIRFWIAQEKYDKLFSLSDDPVYWEKNYHKHSDLIRGKVTPFWTPEEIMDITEKVRAILFNQVTVQGTPGLSH